VRVDPNRRQFPWWQLMLLGLAGVARAIVFPLRRMWRSADPLDAYGLTHLASVAGDALLAIALADSVFFKLPVGQAKLRVAAYLLLTILPLALASPLMVPLLDRAGPRRLISFGAAAGRAAIAIYAAPRIGTLILFPAALALLALSKVHAITKNGLTMAYASHHEGLMRANARLGRIAAIGAVAAAPLGLALLRLFSARGSVYVMYLASAMYGVDALLTLRLPHPRAAGTDETRTDEARTDEAGTLEVRGSLAVGPRGRIRALTGPAVGAVGMRAASGFLLFLLAFSLREGHAPAYWFVVIAGAGVAGGFLADLVAPGVPTDTREEAIVIASVSAAGVGALLAFEIFGLPLLTVYALVAGAAGELTRLAFQSLMQNHAPPGALGRVFVRYEVLFQVAWVGGALLPALLPIRFRAGILMLAAFYGALGVAYVVRARRRHRRPKPPPAPGGPVAPEG
jgi:hypothetical protein